MTAVGKLPLLISIASCCCIDVRSRSITMTVARAMSRSNTPTNIVTSSDAPPRVRPEQRVCPADSVPLVIIQPLAHHLTGQGSRPVWQPAQIISTLSLRTIRLYSANSSAACCGHARSGAMVLPMSATRDGIAYRDRSGNAMWTSVKNRRPMRSDRSCRILKHFSEPVL